MATWAAAESGFRPGDHSVHGLPLRTGSSVTGTIHIFDFMEGIELKAVISQNVIEEENSAGPALGSNKSTY